MQRTEPFIQVDKIFHWIRTAPFHHKMVLLTLSDLIAQGKIPSTLTVYNEYQKRIRAMGLAPLSYRSIQRVLQELEDSRMIRRTWFRRRKRTTKVVNSLVIPPEAIRDIFRYLYPSWRL